MLLTAYADTDAAIAAINEANINHYLLKPWDPPEENLYPVLDDLLEEWGTNFRPPFEGIRVLGNRWSPQSHTLRDFLARNHVPYQWMDIEAAERDPEVRRVVDSLNGEASSASRRASVKARLPCSSSTSISARCSHAEFNNAGL